MLADEFNDIPIKPQINITNSTTVKIRFITVLAFLGLFFEQQIQHRVHTTVSLWFTRE